MPVALPADPSLRPRARKPRSACHPAVRCTSESRHPADQEFLRRNSSNRHPADSQRWPLATDHWQLLAGACPPAPRPAHRPLARSPQPACHPAVRRPAVRTWPQPFPFVIRDAQRGGLTTRTKHGRLATQDSPRDSSAHRQPADSPPRQPAPGDGQPPTGPTRPFYAQRTVPSPDGPKSPEPALDLSCARPRRTLADPRRHAPAPRLDASHHSPAQSRPHAVPIRPPDDQYCKTYRTHYSYEQLATRKSGALRRCFSLRHPAAALSRQPTAGTRRLPARPAPCGRTPRPTVPSRLRHSHAPARRHCFSRPSISAAHDLAELWSARGALRPHPHATPHPTAAPTPSQSVPIRPPDDQYCKTYRTHYSYERLATHKSGALRRCFSLRHPAAALSRQPTAGARRLPAGPSPCGRTPRPTVPSRLRHSHAPARRHCFSRPSISAAHDPAELWPTRGAPRPHPRATPHPTARPKAARSPSRPYPQMIRPADSVVLTTRTKFEPRADQALLRRNSSLRQLADSQRWPLAIGNCLLAPVRPLYSQRTVLSAGS